MHTVIGGCREDILNEAWKFPNIFGVNPELKKYCDLIGNKKYDRMKSKQWYRKQEDNFQVLNPAQSECHGQIVMFSRMVRHMRRPPEPLTVWYIMRPIAAKIKNYNIQSN